MSQSVQFNNSKLDWWTFTMFSEGLQNPQILKTFCQDFMFLDVFKKHDKSPPIDLKITQLYTLKHFLIIYDTFGSIWKISVKFYF